MQGVLGGEMCREIRAAVNRSYFGFPVALPNAMFFFVGLFVFLMIFNWAFRKQYSQDF
jgi:hypothetical protein